MPSYLKLKSGIFLLLLIMTLAACATVYQLPAKHPEELDLGSRLPICTDCHESRDDNITYELFSHISTWYNNHRFAAYQQEQVCNMCHQQSYCNECHAVRVELKPSDKIPDQPYRRMPHRGDYLSRHAIEGRINPTSCFRCHGNPKTAQTCAPCHG